MPLAPLASGDGGDIVPIIIMVLMIGGGALMNWIASIGKAKRIGPGTPGRRAAPPPMAQPRQMPARDAAPSQRMSEIGPSNLPSDAMTAMRATLESASQGRGAERRVEIAAVAARARAVEEQKRQVLLSRRKAEAKALARQEDALADLTAQRAALERGDVAPDEPSERIASGVPSERAPRSSGMAGAQRKRGVGFAFLQKLSPAQRLVVTAEILTPRGRSPLRRMDGNAGRPGTRPQGRHRPSR